MMTEILGEPLHFNTHVSTESLALLGGRLDVDPKEFIPCSPGTKHPLVRGFNRPWYETNWDRVLRDGPKELNVAMLFGKRSRYFGVDCDTPASVAFMADRFTGSPVVQTARGKLFLGRSEAQLRR